MSWQVHTGDCLEVLPTLEPVSVQTCVTSPPYWGLRDYGTDGQLGLEPTPEKYVANLVSVFREVRRVLRDDGTVWLNLGDSYAANRTYQVHNTKGAGDHTYSEGASVPAGLKPKDLVGIPWRVAFAFQTDGWWLRSDIIWSKPNPMPESVTDRPTRAHEYIFLLSKSARYFYDADAIREPHARTWDESNMGQNNGWATSEKTDGVLGRETDNNAGLFAALPNSAGRNRRSVWEIATQPYSEAHFATFPPKLVEPCILAGSANNDLVLDPFAGAGTTGVIATRHNRDFIGIELSEEYAEMARNRIRDDAPLFNGDEAYSSSVRQPTTDRQSDEQQTLLTGGAYSPPGQTPHSNARHRDVS